MLLREGSVSVFAWCMSVYHCYSLLTVKTEGGEWRYAINTRERNTQNNPKLSAD